MARQQLGTAAVSNTQVITLGEMNAALATKQPRIMTGTIATAAGTATKTVTLDSPWNTYVPAAGDWFLFKFTFGTGVANTTINVNNTADRTVRSLTGSQLGANLSYETGASVLMYFDGTYFRPSLTTYGEIPQANLILTTDSTPALFTGRRAEDLMVNEATKTRTLTNKTLTNPKVNAIFDATNGLTTLGFSGVASAVNSLYVGNAITGGTPHIKAQGSDTNVNIAVSSKGTGQVRIQDGNWVNILAAAGVTSAVNYLYVYNAATGNAPAMQVLGTDTNINLNLQSKGTGVVQANGVEVVTLTGTQTLTNKTLTSPRISIVGDANGAISLNLPATASAVNYVSVTNAATGGTPTIAASGSDANVNLNLTSKGTGTVRVNGVEVATLTSTQTLTNKTLTTPRINQINDTNGVAALGITATTSAVNSLQIANQAAGTSPRFTAIGTDTNVGIGMRTKGTGSLQIITDAGVTPTIRAGNASDTNISLNLQPVGTGVVQANGVEVVTISGTQTLTNKTINGDNNTLSNVAPASIKATGTRDATTYLRGDGTWSVPSGGGGSGAPMGYLATALQTSAVAPLINRNNFYNQTAATEPWEITLPALSGLSEGDGLTITKLDASPFVLIVNCAGADDFNFGGTSLSLSAPGEAVTVFVIGGKWQIAHGYLAASNVVASIGGLVDAYYVSKSTQVNGKELSADVTLTQDDIGDGTTYKQYSATEKTKLAGIASGATAYTDSMADARVAADASVARTLTNKRIEPRVVSTSANTATYTINTDVCDVYLITGQAVNITSISTTGTPASGQRLLIGITGTATRSIVFSSSSFSPSSSVALPTNAFGTARNDYWFVYDAVTARWRLDIEAQIGTFVTLTNTQTLTNKTLTNPTLTNYTETRQSISNSGTAKTFDISTGTIIPITMTDNCTFTMPSVGAGKSFMSQIYTGAGGFTGTFTGVKWPGGTAPTLTTTASRLDLVSFVSDGTNWYGSITQNYTP